MNYIETVSGRPQNRATVAGRPAAAGHNLAAKLTQPPNPRAHQTTPSDMHVHARLVLFVVALTLIMSQGLAELTASRSRRLQAAAEDGTGGAAGAACTDFDDRTEAVNDECCNEPVEDCSSGRPAKCNLGCARVLLPYFDDCGALLPLGGAALFGDIVALCHAALFDALALCRAATDAPSGPTFPGSQILTPESDAALAGFVAEAPTGATGWALCFSSFTDDASDASTFHAQCDQFDTTVVIARHGPVPETGTVGTDQRHPEYDVSTHTQAPSFWPIYCKQV